MQRSNKWNGSGADTAKAIICVCGIPYDIKPDLSHLHALYVDPVEGTWLKRLHQIP
jgi:hypothetical protein